MLECYVLDIIEGRRLGRPLLRALSYLYRTGVAIRNEAYDSGILKAHDAGLPVISVGNIIAGGTGKTPFVKFLAEELSKKFQIAIVSRGYRSNAEKTDQVFQVTPETDVAACGDEPYWLARVLPKVQVWVGKNRLDSARQAKEKGAEVVLMDDGMQHRKLKRDIEIVLVDGEDPFGKGFFLPRGFLRDSPARLKKADCIVVIDPSSNGIEQEIRRYSDAPLVFAQRETEVSFKGKKVAVFCAIGKPQKFLQSVRQAEGEIVASFFKPDHEPFYPEELKKFAEESLADVLVCTEKDQVKLPSEFNLETAVRDGKVMQDFESELVPTEGNIPQMVKGPSVGNDSGSKDCVNLPSPTAVSRFKCRLPIVPLTSHLKISGNETAWQELLNNIQSRVKQ